jgi:hypothetical protein
VITVLSIVAVSAISSARISSNFLCFVIVVIPPSLVWHITEYQPDFAIIVYLTKLSTRSVYQMRKLTPEERLAKQAAQHTHTDDCGHLAVSEPVVEEVVAEPVLEATPEPVAEEAPVAEEVVAEPVVEEVVAESKPKKKSAPKY